jgi:(Z)-2-((N-methylformamido)methylene)-5-hydroxybutyrolactone dehydrogenase
MILMKSYDHFINGQWVAPGSGDYFESTDPYHGDVWCKVARGNAADADKAVAAAKAAFRAPEWRGLTASARGKLIYKLADAIEAKAEHLAKIEVRDNGKLYAEMLGQCRYIAEWYRYYGGLADKVEGAVIPTDKAAMFNFTRYEPLGVIAAITPWNSPLLLLTWKLAAALAAGNVMVVKPSEFTSASTLEFAAILHEAGLPAGVLNVITGYGAEAGAPLAAHKDVAKIAFTGSDEGGQRILAAAAPDIKHVTLELGGKSPNIVFEDADFESAVMGVISGIFAASGQTCIAGSRLLVQQSIHDAFVKRLVEVAKAAKIGDPMDSATNVGPVTTVPQYQKVLDYIAIAKAEGATCVMGGKPYEGPDAKGGQMVEPTVFTGVNNKMRIAQEEVFGPVLAVIPFKGEEDAIAIANDIRFGLAAGVWTKDIGRALRMSEQLEAGTVWVNTYRAVSYLSPFGGYKRSGLGRESGLEAIKDYLQVKSVWIATQTSAANPFVMR